MLGERKVESLRQYLLDRMGTVCHPFDPENSAKVYRFQNLPQVVEIFSAFLVLECPVDQVQSAGSDIIQSFHNYITAPRSDWEQAKSAVEHLATKFEAFLKKVFCYRYPGEPIPDHSLYRLLRSHKVISLRAQPRRPADTDYWRQQLAREAVIEKVYLLRNPAAHDAVRLEDLEASMRSILAACLFVVEENLDLLKQAVWGQMAREWEAYLQYAARFFDDGLWEEKKYIWPRTGNVDLMEQMEKFLDDETRSVLFITGRPGAGKTGFLKRWANSLAEQALANLEATGSVRPESLVPLYVDLNNYAAVSGSSFAQYIVLESGLARYVPSDLGEVSIDAERFLRDSPVRFVVCLDALDEMKWDPGDPGGWDRSLGVIHMFLNAGVVSKIVITCRDGVMPGPWRQRYEVLSIAPLTLDDIHGYYYAHLRSSAEAAYIFMMTPDRRELLELMHIPLMLEAAVEYWKQFETPPELQADGTEESSQSKTPSLGELVDFIFQRVLEWEHDKSLHQGLDLEPLEWQEKLGELAYWVDGKGHVSQVQALQFVHTEDDLVRFRNMGVLQTHRSSIRFLNGLTCAYFAALRLKRMAEDGDATILPPDYREHRAFWRQCVEILQKVTYRDMTALVQQVTAAC